MIGLLQRVSQASVTVEHQVVASIGQGLLVFVGIERDDETAQASRLLARLLDYRVFADDGGRMNRSVRDVGGSLLLVPQFTLAADTARGNRPGFASAKSPELAKVLFESMLSAAKAAWPRTQSGIFGADMQVSLINDGPVTFCLHTR